MYDNLIALMREIRVQGMHVYTYKKKKKKSTTWKLFLNMRVKLQAYCTQVASHKSRANRRPVTMIICQRKEKKSSQMVVIFRVGEKQKKRSLSAKSRLTLLFAYIIRLGLASALSRVR